MNSRLSLTLFAHVCGRPDDEIDLAEAALLIAEVDHPSVDVARYRKILDDLGKGVRAAIAEDGDPGDDDEARLEIALRWLYGEAGFRGNTETYYDARNSFLDQVIDRRMGIPITLAVLVIEVCRRAGIDARGVSFPGHFLVRSETQAGHFIVDPFSGEILSHDDVATLFARSTGETGAPPSRLLAAAPTSQILYRILSNLRGIYATNSDLAHLRAVLERMQVLSPSAELRRELDQLGGSTPYRSHGSGVN